MGFGRPLLLAVLLTALGCPTDPPDDPSYGEPQIADVGWALHDVVEAVVVVTWDQQVAAEAYVEVRLDGEDGWRATPATARGEGPAEQLLLGIPYDHGATFRVVNDFGQGPLAGEEHAVVTGPLPLPVLAPELRSSDPARHEPTGRYLIASLNATNPGWSNGEFWILILDRMARPVWAYRTDDKHLCLYVRVAADGEALLWDEATFWSDWDGGAGSEVHRMTLDAVIHDSRPAPGLHHAFTELPDETLAWASTNGELGALMLTPPGGEPEALFDCDAYFGGLGLEPACLVNTVYHHEPTGSFLLSFPEYHTVLEIDGASGDVLRSFGAAPGSWAVDPPEAAFDLQHGVTYTDAGTLLLSTHLSPDDHTGVVREFELDEGGETLHQIWSFGADQGIEADLGGEAHRLPGGNTLTNYGTTPRIREVTPDGEVVWDVAFVEERLLGRTFWVEDLDRLLP